MSKIIFEYSIKILMVLRSFLTCGKPCYHHYFKQWARAGQFVHTNPSVGDKKSRCPLSSYLFVDHIKILLSTWN